MKDVAFGTYRKIWLHPVHQNVEVVQGDIALHQGEVDLPGVEQVHQHLGVAIPHLDIHVWVLFEILGQSGEDGVLSDGTGGAEHQSFPLGPRLLHPPDQGFLVVAQGTHGAQQHLTGRSEGNSFPIPEKERTAIGLLQKANVLGDGGLGDVQLLRGGGEAHMPTYT